MKIVRSFIVFFILATATKDSFAQPSFVQSQKSLVKIADVFSREEDSLKKEFKTKQLTWPPKALYIRNFKFDRIMEVWVRTEDKGPSVF